MNSLAKEKKLKVINELKESGGNWDSLLSKYDEEILLNQQNIEKLSNTLYSLKDNKSISESILQEIEEEKINLEKIISSKKDLIIYLDIKKSQIRKLDIRLKSQENGKDDFLKKLQLEIESLKLELEKLKDNYDDMFSFPKIQDNIKIEMDIIQENIFSKEKELEEKKISELLSKTLSEKTEAMGGKKLLEKNFTLSKYELKRINEYVYRFIGNDGKEILSIEDLGLDINRHGSYFIRKLDDKLIDIVSNDSHYVYDLKNMKLLGQVDYDINLIEHEGNKYFGLRDINTFAADNEYNIFDLKTGEKIFDKKIKGNPWGIKKIGDKEVIYTRIYVGNKTKIHFYAKENGNEIGSKTGYMGDKITFDLDDFSKNPISDNDKSDFVNKMFGMDNVFFIDNGYGTDSISVLDSKNLDKIGDFSTKSGAVKMKDDSMIALKYVENTNFGIIFDLKEQKDLSSDYCDSKYTIKDFDDYCVFTKADGNNLILNKKTKKVFDCMGKISSKFIEGTNLSLIESQKNNKSIKKLANIYTGEILSTQNVAEWTIEDVCLFIYDSNISSNVIIKLKNKNSNFVYAYVNLSTDIDSDGKLLIGKKYDKLDKKGNEYVLSNRFLSKIKIDGYGNKI